MRNLAPIIRKPAVWITAGVIAVAILWQVYRYRLPDRPLRVAAASGPPFTEVRPDGTVAGPSLVAFDEAARRAGIRLQWIASEKQPEDTLPTGEFDMWHALSVTAERESKFYFTKPWVQQQFALVSRVGKVAGKPGLRVGSQANVVDRVQMAKALPGAQAIPFPSWEAMTEALCAGEIDAAFYRTRVALRHVLRRRTDCQNTDWSWERLRQADLPAATGAAPGMERHADRLRQELGRMAADGSLTRIYDQYDDGLALDADSFLLLAETAARERLQRRRVFFLLLATALLAFLGWRVRRTRRLLQKVLDAAAEAAQAKNAFLATVSHEIRTPLNGIIGASSLLMSSGLNTEQREYAETMAASADHLATLVGEVLDFSRLESGRVELETRPFDLERAARSVLRLVEARARAKGLTLELRYDAGCPRRLVGDEGRIRQILLNLVSNAVKFTERGYVRVSLSGDAAADGTVALTIRVDDTGIGIPPEARARIFDKFSQADSSTARRFGGVGLGLSIAKELVGLMNGEISLASTPGEGTSFEVKLWLPRAAGGEKLRVFADLPRFEGRLLVAEDNPVNRRILERLLTKMGLDCDLAADGLEAAAMCESGHYDLILMDCQMPGMDGFEAAAKIRSKKGENRVPIVAVTANVTMDDRARCTAAGMDDFLAKPFDAKTLATTLERWLPAHARTAERE